MISVVLAAVFFVGIHLFVSGTQLRDRLVARLGENGYRGLFAVASAIGLTWLIWAYSQAPTIALWREPVALRPLVILLSYLAFLLVVIGLTTPSPTSVGTESLLEADDPAQGILRITRHPFLSGVTLWAIAHVVVNGEAAGIVLFGAMAVLGATGPASIDAKRSRRFGALWEPFAAKTSIVPFAAVVSGRQSLPLGAAFREIGWWRFALATLIFLVALFGHTWAFGRSPFPV